MNPLTAIKLLVQTAREEEANLTGEEWEVLEDEIGRLEHLLQTFLDFARPPKLQKQPVDVLALGEQLVTFLNRKARRGGVALASRSELEEAWVEADAQQLRQVLLNLALNAIDAQPAGGSVTIVVQRETTDDRSLLIRVLDEGPGLPVELGERIFDPFVSTKDTGIGLGLSLSRRIVASHGGTLSAANRATGGAEFAVRLPVLNLDNVYKAGVGRNGIPSGRISNPSYDH